jgi:hypothetical protein
MPGSGSHLAVEPIGFAEEADEEEEERKKQ